MGASGVKLFDDDLAADVRELFREQLKAGETGSSAARKIVDDFREIIGTEEEGVFWLSLAYVQWEHGMLQDEFLKKALKAIGKGGDLRRWEDDVNLHRKRAKVLANLRRQLQSPRPKARTVRVITRKRIPPKCEWESGDIFAYKLDSGHYLLIRVVKSEMPYPHSIDPLCELLDWVGKEIPEHDFIRTLPIRRNRWIPSESTFQFWLMKKQLRRCQRVGLNTPTAQKYDPRDIQGMGLDGNKLPEQLKERFGMSIRE